MQLSTTPSFFNMLLKLLKHVTIRRRLQLCLLFLLMIVVSFAELVSIGAVLPFLGVLTSPDRIFSHPLSQPLIQIFKLTEPKEFLTLMTVLFGVAAVVSGALRLVLSWAQIRLSYAMGSDFSGNIYERTLYQPYPVHLKRNTSEVIVGVTTKADGIVHQTVMPTLTIISSGVMMTTVLVTLFAIEPAVTTIAIAAFGGIYSVVIQSTRRRLAIDSQLISRQHSLVIKALQEALGGIRDVLIDGVQKTYCQIYRDADWRLRRAQSNIAIVSVSPRFIVEAFGMALIAAMAFVLAARPAGLDSAIPVIGMLALAAQRMLPLLQQAFASWSNIRGGQASFWDVLKFLDQALPDHAYQPAPVPLSFAKEIAVENLGFRYGDDQPWIFENLSLSIPKRGRIGFIGVTGSGKSTLLDIVMGLLTATKGSLKIDGVEINSSNCRAWQIHLAHVPQSIFLADASIAENIAFGVALEKIDYNQIRLAAQRAQIANTIESWAEKYDTVVGEKGVRLSGGQRQRIGIARALYKKADVIVFDEATSSLDSETEYAVMESIKNLGDDLTILIVAHRLTTLRDCTQVVEFADGVIRRAGTYQEIVG
jgi:ABC-type multidrug transport system fused ATPase/permease subunit